MMDASFRSVRTISPWMLTVSAILHGIALAALIHVYATSKSKPITIRGDVTHVKLVQSPSEPAMQKTSHGPTRETEIPPLAEIEPVQPPPPEPTKPTEKIDRASVAAVSDKEIKLKARKKPPQRVEQTEPKPRRSPKMRRAKNPSRRKLRRKFFARGLRKYNRTWSASGPPGLQCLRQAPPVPWATRVECRGRPLEL